MHTRPVPPKLAPVEFSFQNILEKDRDKKIRKKDTNGMILVCAFIVRLFSYTTLRIERQDKARDTMYKKINISDVRIAQILTWNRL